MPEKVLRKEAVESIGSLLQGMQFSMSHFRKIISNGDDVNLKQLDRAVDYLCECAKSIQTAVKAEKMWASITPPNDKEAKNA